LSRQSIINSFQSLPLIFLQLLASILQLLAAFMCRIWRVRPQIIGCSIVCVDGMRDELTQSTLTLRNMSYFVFEGTILPMQSVQRCSCIHGVGKGSLWHQPDYSALVKAPLREDW